MNDTWPQKWGFVGSLTDCIGKTIELAEVVQMPFGCTWRSAWVVRFTDGTRAFFVGATGSGVISPGADEVGKCRIFGCEEYGEMAADNKRKRMAHEADGRRRDERDFEVLKKRLGK